MNFTLCRLEEISQTEYEFVFSEMLEVRKKKVERFMRAEDKKRTLAGEYLAKKLLHELSGKAMSEIVIASTLQGKPYVQGIPYHMSISHSENMVAVAVSEKPVGIDIEKIRPVSVALVNRVCTTKELEYVMQSENVLTCKMIENPNVLNRFFEVWTAKEACFKCNGGNGKSFTEIETLSDTIIKTRINVPKFSGCIVQIKES